ncbi:alpha/beta hydrolase [Anaerostipes sp.]|uniref:alpha/beta hydrolase n=1 Tax=Anaerostipes sp. TaxID=1872530 RepID=UPI0025C2F950|nr:alpha/beta hydrolase-fold protein [Anaerostipes sp.]MBS7009123.1 acetylesterase [Anaerostipes sp.]
MALLKVEMFSAALLRTVTLNVILPVDKRNFAGEELRGDKPFKTLYLLHGIYGNYMDWVSYTRIREWAEDYNLAVVMPSGENSFYLDQRNGYAAYSKFIGEELVNLTRKMFPLSRERQDTYIGGLSMGGYGSIINGFLYGSTFSRIIALSSALVADKALDSAEDAEKPIERRSFYQSVFGDLEKFQGSKADYRALLLDKKGQGEEMPDLYMACGTNDPLLAANREFKGFLHAHEIKHTYEEWEGSHNWMFWDQAIEKFMKWLPLEEKEAAMSSGNVGAAEPQS